MALVRVAAASDLGADSVLEVLVGDTPYAICNVGGKVTALYGICPHRGGHDMDAGKKVAVCELKIECGEILLSLPD